MRAFVSALVVALAGGMLLPVAGARAADRALLVGIDDYADDRLDVPVAGAALNDVGAMQRVLTEKLGFTDGNVRVLMNGKATRAAILEAIDSFLVKGTASGDRAYVYFAGQGYFAADTNGDEADGLDEAIVPADATSAGKTISGLLTDDDLTVALAALTGRRLAVMLDTGHSGRVTRKKTATRSIAVESRGAVVARSPDLAENTRSIAVEPTAAAQKAEVSALAGFIEKAPDGGTLVEIAAVSPSQTALVDASFKQGVFTKLMVEGLEGKADKNGNGSVSNAELADYVATGSEAYCAGREDACEMGLRPQLTPASALGGTLAPEDGGKVAGGALTIDALTDLIARGNGEGVALVQTPGSPVHVGTKGIRFTLASPIDGDLVLFDLADDGKLVQLFPNQFTRKREGAASGKVKAGVPVTVPDAYYGISFNATEPSSGYIVAVVLTDGGGFSKKVATRSIEVIPKQEAIEKVLPEIAAAVAAPAAAEGEENTRAARSAVVTLRYEIVP